MSLVDTAIDLIIRWARGAVPTPPPSKYSYQRVELEQQKGEQNALQKRT